MIQAAKKEFSENKPTWIWRGTMLVLFTLISFIGSWIFGEVSAVPKTYATKSDVRELEQDNDQEHRDLVQKIDEGFRETQKIIIDLHK